MEDFPSNVFVQEANDKVLHVEESAHMKNMVLVKMTHRI